MKNRFVVSENNKNPLTENIGGGDGSQNRFEKTFVIVRQEVNYDTDDSFTYLTFESFLGSISSEIKRNMVKDMIEYGLSVSQDFIEGNEERNYLPGTIYFSKIEAIKFQDQYFVLQRVS